MLVERFRHALRSLILAAKSSTNDGGWGWVIVIASFVCQIIVFGTSFSVGVFYVEFLEEFQQRKGDTAWIGSINTGLLFGAGPISSFLVAKLGHRLTVIIGGILASTGLVLSAFATSIYYLYLSYGVVAGFGYCFCYVPSVVVVSLHFNKRRNLALGIAVSGCGVGSLVFAPAFRLLIDYYGWRGALLIVGGICLNLIVCGALMRPPKTPMVIEEKSDHVTSVKNRQKDHCDITLLCDLKFLILFVNNILWNLGSLILFVQVTAYAQACNIGKEPAAFLLSAIGICNTIGRLLVAFAGSHRRCNRFLLYVISNGVSGLAITLFPTNCTYVAFMSYASTYGLFFGIQLACLAMVTLELFGVERLNSAYGYIMFANGAGAMLGPPIAGWVYDVTLSYDIPFYLGGGVTMLSTVMMLLIPLVKKFEKKEAIVLEKEPLHSQSNIVELRVTSV